MPIGFSAENDISLGCTYALGRFGGRMSDDKGLHDRKERVVDETEIIGTHEHLLQEKEQLSAKPKK